jgi:CRP-like cAMP-binding protein
MMGSKVRSPEIYRLLRSGIRTAYSKGQIVQSTEGQKTINFVTRGFIKRYLISNTGKLDVEVIYGPGDFFPVTLMLETFFELGIYEGPEVYFYEAMTATTIYTANINVLTEAAKNNPILYKDLLHETGRRLHTTLNSLENISLTSTYSRLAHQLVYFANLFGEQINSGIKIMIPLSSQDIADVLSLDSKEVTKHLSEMREKNLIRMGRYIIISNLERLKEEAHS